MPSLPKIHQGRQQRDEGLAAWAQAPSPFNTPPLTGDSVEPIDLFGLSMPVASRTGDNYAYNYQQFQARPNQEYYWNQNSTPFDNTPPPQGDSFDNNITDLLSLNMPRGSLLGNTNPIGATTYNVNTSFDSNSPHQNQQGMKYACYQTPRYEPPTNSTPRKTGRSHDLTQTSLFSQVSPICPPQQISSPPYISSRNSSDDSILYHSPTKRLIEPSKQNAENGNAPQNSSGMFCPTTDQELTNIQSLYSLRKETELVNRIIEQTSRLLLAAVNSPEIKSNEPPQFPTPEKRLLRYHQRSMAISGTNTERNGAIITWSGTLPPRIHNNPTYSCKVFLGGVPWDITEMTLIQAFSRFGSIKIEWPGKDMSNQASQPKGYAYIIFETEKKVKALLDYCIHDFSKGGNWYYRLSSRKLKSKEVQVIPWAISDSNYAQVSQKLDPQMTVFVGALHGMINAKALAQIMNDLFGGVIYAGLDTDKYKYPIGSARVTFNNYRSYMKAVRAGFIDIKTTQFSKKVQVNPYLEDSPCSICSIQQGPYFCRELSCFSYYCRGCWYLHHSSEQLSKHNYLTRNSKNNAITNGNMSSNVSALCVSHNTLQPHNAL